MAGEEDGAGMRGERGGSRRNKVIKRRRRRRMRTCRAHDVNPNLQRSIAPDGPLLRTSELAVVFEALMRSIEERQ